MKGLRKVSLFIKWTELSEYSHERFICIFPSHGVLMFPYLPLYIILGQSPRFSNISLVAESLVLPLERA